MTETSVQLQSKDLRGATLAIAFEELSPVDPYSADRIAVVNPSTQRIVMVARDEDRGAPRIAAISSVISPAPSAVAVHESALYSLADWSVTANGQIRRYLSSQLSTPLVSVTDPDAGGPIAIAGDGVDAVVVHGRTRNGSSLVARNVSTLAELATIQLPAPPVAIVRNASELYVFCKARSQVERVTWDSGRQRFNLDQAWDIPQASLMREAAFDGRRLAIVSADVLVLFDTTTEEIELVHRDTNADLASVSPVADLASIIDGLADPEYLDALNAARYAPGKDRKIRDHYTRDEMLSRVGVAAGTYQPPMDALTTQRRQPIVRRVGHRWMVLDGVTGYVALSGDLVWRFRGGNVAEQPRSVAYTDADAPAGTDVSRETAVKLRHVWDGDIQWRKTTDGERYAYFDGSTSSRFGSVKSLNLPLQATLSFWVRAPTPVAAGVYTLLHQAFTGVERTIALYSNGAGGSEVRYNNQFAPSPVDLFDGGWHHVVLVLEGTMPVAINALAYVDTLFAGALGINAAWTPANPGNVGASVYLGRKSGDTPQHFLGWLGDCRAYKLAAAPEFITDLYARGPLGNGGTIPIVDGALLLEDGGSLLLEDGGTLLLE